MCLLPGEITWIKGPVLSVHCSWAECPLSDLQSCMMRGEERVPLLGSSAPSAYSHLSETLSPPPERQKPEPRLRSNSVCVFTEHEEEEVVFTSYGPVVLEEDDRPRLSRSPLVGWLLAVLSGLLFTGNNFLVKFYTIGATDMLLVRSAMQTLLMAVIIGNNNNNTTTAPRFKNIISSPVQATISAR